MLDTDTDWKKKMLALPDDTFFEIMRNYLGELQTPFNKHNLIESLGNLLRREDTWKRVSSMIDNDDRRILTAVDFLAGADIHELHNFLKPEMTIMTVHHLLLNLEERLLVYRDIESNKIHISPVFQNLLRAEVTDTGLLFPSEECRTDKSPDIWFTDSLVVAFISFICKNRDLLKQDGSIKKKTESSIAAIFPELTEPAGDSSKLEILIQGMLRLSLIEIDSDEIRIVPSVLKEFSELPVRQRYLMYAASAISECVSPSAITGAAEFILSFIQSIPQGRKFWKAGLLKLVMLLKDRKEGCVFKEEIFLEQLVLLNLLTPIDGGYAVNSHFIEHLSDEPHDEPPVLVMPSLTITARPWITLSDGLKFAVSSDIVKYDLYPDFELNRASFTRGHNCSFRDKSLKETLAELGNKPLAQNIVQNMDSWEKEYSTIRVYHGTVLSVSPDKSRIIGHLQNFNAYIYQKLTDTVFLMDTEREKEWREILTDAGINVPGVQRGTPDSPVERSVFRRMEIVGGETSSVLSSAPPKQAAADTGFLDELEEKINSEGLTQPEAEEYKARISKKLILFPDQIKPNSIKIEKSEATGLDYTGKIRLIERAIDSGTELLEITFGHPLDKVTSYLVKPSELDKSEEDLILNATTLPEENRIRLVVRKMSRVKRLKSSLFAPQQENPAR